jgi:DNA-binding CsgD family transcriptional regulator
MPLLPRTTEDRFRLAFVVFFLVISIGFLFDVLLDLPQRVGPLHLVMESSIIILSLVFASVIAWRWQREHRAVRSLQRSLAEHQEERDQWRTRTEQLVRGLGAEIDLQLRTWSLTPSEREIALFLLKGYGHRQIAAELAKSERTVQGHAAEIYRKSGLATRAELSAFFLENLIIEWGSSEANAQDLPGPPRPEGGDSSAQSAAAEHGKPAR